MAAKDIQAALQTYTGAQISASPRAGFFGLQSDVSSSYDAFTYIKADGTTQRYCLTLDSSLDAVFPIGNLSFSSGKYIGLATDGILYFGDPSTDGTYKVEKYLTTGLAFYKRVSGSYTSMGYLGTAQAAFPNVQVDDNGYVGKAASVKWTFNTTSSRLDASHPIELQDGDTIGAGNAKFAFNSTGTSIQANSNAVMSVGVPSTASVLSVEGNSSSLAKPILRIKQIDLDQPLIQFEGYGATDTTKSFSTQNGDGSVEGPKNFSSTAGWSFIGMVRCSVVDGATVLTDGDVWLPLYTPDAS